MSKKFRSTWSDWEWAESSGCEARYRMNAKGEPDWEFRDPPTLEDGIQPNDPVDDLSYKFQDTNLVYSQELEQGKGKGPATTTNLASDQYDNNYYGQPTPEKSSGTRRRNRRYNNPAGKENLQLKKHYSSDFQLYKIFKCIWSEPDGRSGTGNTQGSQITEPGNIYGEAYSKVRPFLIVGNQKGCSVCLPIMTYGGQGTLKSGVHPETHAMIYSLSPKPDLLRGERLDKKSIKVEIKDPRHPLDPASRLNYAKLYTVEHNVRVHFIGKVDKKYENRVATDFNLAHPPLPVEGEYALYGSQELQTQSSYTEAIPRDHGDAYYDNIDAQYAQPEQACGEGSSRQHYDSIDPQQEWTTSDTGNVAYESGGGSRQHQYDEKYDKYRYTQ